ncbi:hypothetical protein ACOZDF_13650 [Streptomyces griseoincarnatus]|uniref:hypothetical protein n=1 Tax=Streptomyces tunisiensis TaxID=948699 RepID=UPI003EE1CA3A
MSGAGVQSLLALLLTDDTALEEAAATPQRYARRFGVPLEEVRRLCHDDAPRLRMTARMTRWKRLGNAETALPGTMRMCRAVWDDDTIITRVLATASMATPYGVIRTAHRLGRLTAEGSDDTDHPLIDDIVRYESLCFELRSRSAAPAGYRAVRGPALGEHAVLAKFGCQVVEVYRRLLADEPFDDLRDAPSRFVLTRGSGGGVRPLKTSPSLYALLRHCDGSRPLSAVAEGLGLSAEAVERALGAVRAQGVEIHQ